MTRARAPTYVDEDDWTPVKRTRCTVCKKVVFPDEAAARDRAARITATRRPMKAYLGKKCGHWHLARVQRSRKA